MSLLRRGSLLTLVKLVNSGLSIALILVLANRLGASRESDSLFIALFISVTMARDISRRIRMVLVPCLVEEREKGRTDFVSSFSSNWALISLATCGLVVLTAPALVTILSPGFTPDARSLTILLMRQMAPCLFLLGVVASAEGFFLSHERFYIPEAGQFLWRAVVLSSLYFVDRLGVHAYVWGVLCASALQVVFLAVMAGGTGFRLISLKRPKWDWSVLAPFFSRMGIGFASLALAQVRSACTRSLASLMAVGSITILTYSSRVVQFLPQLMAASFFTVLLPNASRVKARSGDLREYVRTMCGLLLAIGFPIGMAAFWGAPDAAEALFRHGRFTADNAHLAAGAIRAFGVGVPTMFVIVAIRGSYMIDRTLRQIVEADVVNILVFVPAALALRRFELPGLVYALSAGVWAQAIHLWLRRKLPLRWDVQVALQLTALAAMAAAFYGPPWRTWFLSPIVRLLTAGSAAFAVYGAVAYPLVRRIAGSLKLDGSDPPSSTNARDDS